MRPPATVRLAVSYLPGRSPWQQTAAGIIPNAAMNPGVRFLLAMAVDGQVETEMKTALKYPIFYLAPAEHMVYVFWREENVTTRRLLAEADGWAGQEVVDSSGRRYTIRRCREIGPAGRRTVRYDTDFEQAVSGCTLGELQAWIAREYPRSELFREACWCNAADFRQAVFRCRNFEELARMFRCRPEEEPSIRRDLVHFLAVALVVGIFIWLLARYT